MRTQIRAYRFHIALAAMAMLCLYLLFFHRLAGRDLWNSHEARAGMNGQTISTSGQWLVPSLYDGQWELQKPPLYYWMVAALAQLNNGTVNAWHVRLPSALSAIGCLLILLWLCHSAQQLRTGIFAAIVLATAVHFTWLARVGRIDMPLTLAVSIALAGLYCSFDSARPWPFQLVAYLAIAAGILLKGPIALALPGSVIGAYLIVQGELKLAPQTWLNAIRRTGCWWGLPLVLAVTVPWFILANQATDGEFFHSFFWLHNIQRGLGGSRLRGHPVWHYGPQFLIDFLPWSPLLFWLLIQQWRSRLPAMSAPAKFGLIWWVTMMALLSLSRYKRADYLVPCYPGAALVVGSYLARITTGDIRKLQWVAAWVVLCAAGWLIRAEILLPIAEPAREHRRFASAVLHHAPPSSSIVFYRTESHPLAFHLGRPLSILIYPNQLDRLPNRPTWVVIPESLPLGSHFPRHQFQRVLSNSDLIDGSHEKPLVLYRLTGSVLESRP